MQEKEVICPECYTQAFAKPNTKVIFCRRCGAEMVELKEWEDENG